MKINHLGIAVRNISTSVRIYNESLGWEKETDIIHDPIQKVKVLFMIDNHGNRYELIEPATDDSPINKFIERRISLYHFCYETENIKLKIEELTQKSFILISGPTEAIAFNYRLIAFLINQDNLIIELIEQ